MDVHDVHEFEAEGDAANLMVALRESEPRVRQEACYALGQLRRGDAVAQLTERLAIDTNESVRAAAADALGWIRDRGAVPQLLRSFQDDPDDDVQARAAGALGSLGDPAAIPALEAAARTHLPISFRGLHRESQLEAVRALGKLRPDPAAESALHSLELSGGEIGRVARQALLPTIVWGSYHQEALRHVVTEAGWGEGGWLVEAELRADPENAYDPDAVAVVAIASGMTIGYLRNDYAAGLSRPLRVEGPMPCTVEIRGARHLAASMVALGAAAGAPDSRAPARPRHAGDVLRDEAVAHLSSCVSPEMTIVCLRHLGSVSGGSDASLVMSYLTRPEPTVRATAADVLGDWRAAEAVTALAALVPDDDVTVREAAARALEKIDTPEARDTLAQAQGDAAQDGAAG
jgi:HEAT repeat protein